MESSFRIRKYWSGSLVEEGFTGSQNGTSELLAFMCIGVLNYNYLLINLMKMSLIFSGDGLRTPSTQSSPGNQSLFGSIRTRYRLAEDRGDRRRN